MSTTSRLDRIRQSALDDVDKSEKNVTSFIWSLAVLEFTLAAVYIALAVLGFSDAVLIGVAGVCIYCMTLAGVSGLKLHVDTCTARVIKAIELLAEAEEDA